MNKTENDITTKSEVLSDIITRIPSKLIRWGSVLFFLLVVLMLLLMWVIKYPDVISANGYLTIPIAPQKLYAKTTARIDTLMVSDNTSVDKNEILAILENTAISRDILLLKSITDTLLINQNKVLFPFQELPILFLGELDIYYSNFETSYYQYSMNKDLKPYTNKKVTNISSLTQQKHQLNNLVTQKTIHEKELVFIKKDLNRHKLLLDKGVISQQAYESKELDYYSELKSFENTKLIIFQLRESIEQSKGNTNNLEFLKQRESTKLLKQVLQSYSQLKKGIRDWELKYVLESNSEGVVSFLEQWHANQIVTKDKLMFTVSSDYVTHYIAKLKTPTNNSGKIKIGQDVNFILNDFPEHEFGVLKGQVVNITNVSNASGHYLVDVKISKDLKTAFGKRINFKQDMQGTANIITEDLSLLERLFYQFRHLFRI